jgi:hypothetical protein
MVGDQEFVALDDLSHAVSADPPRGIGSARLRSLTRADDHPDAGPVAGIRIGRLISLPAPPSRSGRRWLVPVEFISRALAPIYDVPLDFRKPSHLLVIGDLRVPRVTSGTIRSERRRGSRSTPLRGRPKYDHARSRLADHSSSTPTRSTCQTRRSRRRPQSLVQGVRHPIR